MKRARKLGRRYIRTITDAFYCAFRNARTRELILANVTRNNALLRKLMSSRPEFTPMVVNRDGVNELLP